MNSRKKNNKLKTRIDLHNRTLSFSFIKLFSCKFRNYSHSDLQRYRLFQENLRQSRNVMSEQCAHWTRTFIQSTKLWNVTNEQGNQQTMNQQPI